MSSIQFSEIETLGRELVRGKKTFRICGIVAMNQAVETIERVVESENLRCRIYTSKRAAAMAASLIPTGVTQLVGMGTAVGIAAHNLATWNPDYEIVKHTIDNAIDVVYMK